MMGSGLVFMLLFWGVLIALAAWGLGGLFSREETALVHSPVKSDRVDESALEILQRRYARGEISKAEYEALRQELNV